ncbi:epidermal growth factor receptor substrate 15-like 1 isoform X9 [Heterocephalus glaber]|uniref:Epidermal growth factor receptor substrate 15-like 1 isoform X9 n=1 Tax=Heterocephalus glaber TaxID=10181 RepID=A0AAX6SFI8_HETGA|nr:epidermal growth factor receptor substrate 15-like 1 isoform X9 [Heterocephalus glaber]
MRLPIFGLAPYSFGCARTAPAAVRTRGCGPAPRARSPSPREDGGAARPSLPAGPGMTHDWHTWPFFSGAAAAVKCSLAPRGAFSKFRSMIPTSRGLLLRTCLHRIPGGNPLYESYYKQVDPAYTGRVGASEAALFLKKSGLSDVTLGKIWDLADPEGKGFLDKQTFYVRVVCGGPHLSSLLLQRLRQEDHESSLGNVGFYVALRLVACAQSGHEVTLSNLNLSMPPPKFVSAITTQHDTSSPLMVTLPSAEAPWAVRVEEKAKFDGIFESLLPVKGLLSGDKVKPVLMNSKLPLDVLGRVWDLSDIDKDGHLDRDEFAVAMHLVYRALEKEPVPSILPLSLIPLSKRKKPVFPGAVPVLPGSPPPKDSLRSTPSHGSVSSLNSTGSLSPKHSLKQAQPAVAWVVPVADKMRFDEIFLKTDLDLDGYVSGQEVKEIFMHSGLTQSLLAHIWALADTRQMGKLSKDQFALAMHLIQQKVSKGVDPPQALSPDMVPPSERGTPVLDSASSLGSGEFTGVKELDDISQEIAQLQREKYSLEQDIREKEEAIRQKTSEVQELQNDLDRETSSLQELEAQKQDAQDRLDEMDQQKAKLRDMLSDVRQKCQDETQMISSLKTQIQSQESDLKSQEDDLNRAKSELSRLQQEETQLEQSIQAGRAQLETILKSLQSTEDEISQVPARRGRRHTDGALRPLGSADAEQIVPAAREPVGRAAQPGAVREGAGRRGPGRLGGPQRRCRPGREGWLRSHATTPRTCTRTPSRLRTLSSPTPSKALTPSKVTRSRATPSQSSRQQPQIPSEGTLSKKATHSVALPLTTSSKSRQRVTRLPPTPSPRPHPSLQSSTPSSPATPSPPASPREDQTPSEPWTPSGAGPSAVPRASLTSARCPRERRRAGPAHEARSRSGPARRPDPPALPPAASHCGRGHGHRLGRRRRPVLLSREVAGPSGVGLGMG